MKAIYKRELKAYLQSFVGFLFIGVTLFFLGLYFTVYNLVYGYPYFSYAIGSVLFLFFISIPVLTMRILAEERKQKTDQLILTAPVTVGSVVMGKFLALTTVFAIPTVIICFYPLILSRFGTIPMSETYLAILAFFLYGVTCIAIGLFVSSLTESQVIAAVLTFGFLFLGYMMSSICGILSSTGNLLTKLLRCYDLYTPYDGLTNGTLNLESLFYFISLTVLMLFLTVQSIQKRRYSISVKSLSPGAYSSGMIVIAVAVTVVFNLLIGQLPGSIKSVDITSNRLYSITDQTKAYLDTLKEDVTVYVLVNKDTEDTTIGQTLQRYADYSGHIKVEYVDPAVNPRFHLQYTSSSISANSLIVVSDRRSTVVDASDMYESTMDYQTYSYIQTGYDGEGRITSAIDYVLSEDVSKIYMTTGHGEYDLETEFTSSLEKENVDYETISLLDYESVPEDASALFINAPVSDFSDDDAAKVLDYLAKGGNVITVVGYSNEDMSNFRSILDYMGMDVTKGLVVETDADHYYYQSQYLLFPNMMQDSFTSGIYGNYYVYAPYAQGITIRDEAAEGMTYTKLLTTSDSAFAREEYDSNATNLTKKDGDVDGPFAIGVRAEKTEGEVTATMAVYSCDQIFTSQVNQAVSGANLQLFNNTVTSFLEGHESSISIPVKSYEVSSLTMPGSSVILIGLITAVLLPLAMLIVGFIIWFKRRKR